MKSIFDPSFRYTASYNTDLRKTFARIKKEQRERKAAAQQPSAVVPITHAKGGGR